MRSLSGADGDDGYLPGDLYSIESETVIPEPTNSIRTVTTETLPDGTTVTHIHTELFYGEAEETSEGENGGGSDAD